MHHVKKLKNGITLITVPVEGTKAATILAMFPVGSRYENPKISGISHFVEHMLFKGTEKRKSAQDISRTLEAVGADYNAFTYKDYTGYYVKIDGTKQEMAFDLLSDMIFKSVILAAEAEKEKGAIVEELRMYEDNPMMAIDLLSDKLVFKNNTLGWDIGGSEKTVREMTREELWSYYQQHYSPRNMVLVVAGAVPKQKRLAELMRYFESHTSPPHATDLRFYQKKFSPFVWPKANLPWADRVAVEERKVDQAHVIMNFPGLKNNHPDRYALAVLLNILGGGMSSRLFVEVREKRGLAYMVKTSASAFRDVGLCYVQAGLDPARLGEAAKVIKQELQKIAREPVSEVELEDAKNNIAGRTALHMEDSSAQAEWFAKQFLFSPTVQTPDQFLLKLKSVSRAQVQRLAKQLLVWERMRLAVIGPFGKEKVLKLLGI